MKYKIIQGSVKAEKEYKTGEIIELSEKEAKAILREGVIEVYKKSEPVKEEKIIEPVKTEEPKKEEVKASTEPSEEWTRRELDDYAKAHGIEEPEKFGSKAEIMKEIIKNREVSEK